MIRGSVSDVFAPGGAVTLDGGVSAVFVNIDAARSALERIEDAVPRLSADQRMRFEAMAARDTATADRWRAAHIALRVVLERYAGPGVRRLPYAIAPGGRPSLPGNQDVPHALHFSLSHTGGFAAIAIAHGQAIGIDLEMPRSVKMTAVRRQRIEEAGAGLAPSQRLPDAGTNARFLQCWVRLEAFAKATGFGIGKVLTAAGAVGGNGASGLSGEMTARVAVCDLCLPHDCLGAIAAGTLPEAMRIEEFPAGAAGLAAYLQNAG